MTAWPAMSPATVRSDHGERGVTKLNYLPRRDDAIKRWVDAIDVRVPSLESTPGQGERAGARARRHTIGCALLLYGKGSTKFQA
jgi:hypothetical protein